MLAFQRNPYLNRSMIRSPEAFFGRQREVARVAQRLAASPPQSVAVVGDRRIGKSSILNYISHPDVAAQYLPEPERTLFLFLDFQESHRLSVEGFFKSFFRHLREVLPAGYELDDSDATYEGVRREIGRLDAQGYKLILLLDEFDRVTRSANFDADFFSYLRSLAGRYNIAYVASASRNLQELCRTTEIADSPFFNIFTTVPLGPLTQGEARELVAAPATEVSLPVRDHVDDVLALGGRWPFFLQIAASALFEVLLEEDSFDATALENRFIEEATPHFQFFWEHMGPVERSICAALAGGGSVGPREELQELVRRGFVLDEPQRLFSTAFGRFAARTHERDVGEVPMEVQAERAREMEGELEKARQMQLALLPQESPDLQGLEFAADVQAASRVSGDFYTYVELDGGKWAIVAVDVCGHGMEGAVTALRFSETLRYETRGRTEPDEIMGGLNRALYGTLPGGAFVGCCICVVDPATLQVAVAAGGYWPPLHVQAIDGSLHEPDLGSLPLGVRRDASYHTATLQLQPGDLMLLYSDGVVEAADDRNTLYGDERLRELVAAQVAQGASPRKVVDSLLQDVGRFSVSAGAQADDITVIAVRAKP